MISDYDNDSNASPTPSGFVVQADSERIPLLSIIIPVRDDAPSVNIMARVLNALVEVPHELIVVYDSFTDSTVPVIEKLAPTQSNLRGMLNEYGPGVLPAIKTGVRYARGQFVMIYAADEIGPVLGIPGMLELMRSGCDLVSVTRYRGGGRRYGGSPLGHILSVMANRAFTFCSATALSDCTTGIKMFRRELFDQLNLVGEGHGWSFAFEMAIKAQLMGLKLGEVPIVSIDRLFGGQSTFKPLPWVISYARWFIWGIRKLPPWYRPKPRLAFPIVRRR